MSRYKLIKNILSDDRVTYSIMKKGWLFWSYKSFSFFGSYITEHHDKRFVEQKMKAMMEKDAYIVKQETLEEY